MLRKIDTNTVPYYLEEIRLFSVIRNESLRLPYFFDYYAEKGVDRFFIIDNNSEDNTVDIALSNPNTHIFSTSEDFKGNKQLWVKTLLERYGKKQWCLLADADELFYYPYVEQISLREFCHFLDLEGANSLFSILIDMFSRKSISEISYLPKQNPIEVCPYFDNNFFLYKEEGTDTSTSKSYNWSYVHGGVRKRIFNLHCCLSKVPLIKYSPEMDITTGHHKVNNAVFSEINGAILHFKFLQDFTNKVLLESKREQYFNNAEEYKVYHDKVSKNPDLSLWHEQAVRFNDSKQLLDEGIINISNNYQAWSSSKSGTLS